MRITRHITHADQSPYAGISWKTVDVEVYHADASQRVCLTDIEVPAHWSFAAAETFVRYYIRRAGVPAALIPVREEGVPQWLWRKVPDTAALAARKEGERARHETSARQVFDRLAGMWTYWGFKAGYFDTEDDARAFHDEMCALLARQVLAPNSPQWFNAGLHWAYGLTGPAQGHYYADIENGLLRRSTSAFERPQLHACFLHAVKDDLLSEGGIMHLFEREARAFKYGSGAGANMSAIRGAGEGLSSGAGSLGLMRFLTVGDKAAGAIQAGGMPRRAGKMVVVDIDHPDVMPFIRWKGEEQYKAAALITGARVMRKFLSGVMAAITAMEGDERFSPQKNLVLKQAIDRARRALIPSSAIDRVIAYARQGYTQMHIPVYSAADGSDVFFTVSAHQNRQAVRLTDRFMEAVEHKEKFGLRKRTDGSVIAQEEARSMFEDIAHAVWATGEPTLQFSDSIAARHTCPESGPVRASTPASEYLFLDDTACPLAAINLLSCADAKGHVDVDMFSHVVRLATLMLDISVTVAQYPSRTMARLTQSTRPIGIGLANVAGLLVRLGLAYDSDAGRRTVASVFALLTGEAANSSADIAKELGAFGEFTKNRAPYLARIRAAKEAVDGDGVPQAELAEAARRLWEMALIKTEAYGARNAQLTCVPPTSTIARVMDCETLGLLPITQPVRFSGQQGGGARKHLSSNVQYGLQACGLNAAQLQEAQAALLGHGTLRDAPGIDHAALAAHGFGEEQIEAVEEALAQAADIHAAFDPWVLGERFCREQLKLTHAQMFDAEFKVLPHLGFSAAEISAAEQHACGSRSFEALPHVSAAQRRAFTPANAVAQIAMLGAVQPFVSGGIAHTVSLAHSTELEAVEQLIWQAWRAGLTSVSFYREGCALYQDAGLAETDDAVEEPVVFREAVASVSGSLSELATSLAQRFVTTRRDLPMRRHGFTQKATIGGTAVWLRTGEYTEGTVGEVYLDLPKESQLTRALAQHFAQALSLALQYGVPLAAFAEAFTNRGAAADDATAELVEETHVIVEYMFTELSNAYLAAEEAVEEPQAAPTVVSLKQAASF